MVRVNYAGYYTRGQSMPLPQIFCMMLFLVAALGLRSGLSWLLPAWSSLKVEWGKYILSSVLPLSDPSQMVISWPEEWDTEELQHPRSWLVAQMPVLAAGGEAASRFFSPETRALEESEPDLTPIDGETLTDTPSSSKTGPDPNSQPPPEKVSQREVKVLVYTTHNAECYVPDSGAAKVPGKNGGVAEVADVLVKALEEQGVGAVLATDIHDYPDFNYAYVHSATTIKRLMAKYPSISVIVDVHRDAGSTRPEVAKINGKSAARCLFIVGNGGSLQNPNWEKNLAYAKQVESTARKLYPGLCKGVRQQVGRFNQHLCPRAILVEFGNHLNSQAEAEVSAVMLARVLKETM